MELFTCIYRLSDASGNWYLHVKTELCKLGIKYSRFEPTIFFLHSKNKIQSLLIIHLDDFCRGATENFKKILIVSPQKVFSVTAENVKIFKYLGLNIIQNSKYDISLNQTKFVDETKEIRVTGDRSLQKYLGLNDEELEIFKALIGQSLWGSNQTHPDISFNLGELSSSVNYAAVEHILRANKVLKNAKTK